MEIDGYRILTTSEIGDYVVQKTDYFTPPLHVTVTDISDGNLNHVFRVSNTLNKQSVIVKQALPYARTSIEMNLSAERCRIEAQALKIQAQFTPQNVPHVYHYDESLQLLIMEDLGEGIILRKALMEQKNIDSLPEHAAAFFANNIIRTSDIVLESTQKKEQVVQFMNPDLCALTEMLVLTNHSYPAKRNRTADWLMPLLEEKIFSQSTIQKNSALLKHAFMTRAECLLHGDAHTGSVFINEKKHSVQFFDTEFAFYGPMGFDVGMFLANLFLNMCYHAAHHHQEYVHYLQNIIQTFLATFEQNFYDVWQQYATEHFAKQNSDYQKVITEQMWWQIAGYCGCEMIRRTTGSAHVAEMDDDHQIDEQQQSQKMVIQFAVKLLEHPEHYQNTNGYQELLTSFFD